MPSEGLEQDLISASEQSLQLLCRECGSSAGRWRPLSRPGRRRWPGPGGRQCRREKRAELRGAGTETQGPAQERKEQGPAARLSTGAGGELGLQGAEQPGICTTPNRARPQPATVPPAPSTPRIPRPFSGRGQGTVPSHAPLSVGA